MISSASNSPGQPVSGPILPSGQKPVTSPVSSGQESLSADGAATLLAALTKIPEVRPEVVAQGKQLASDSNYPPTVIIQMLAELIARSHDQTR